MTKERPILFSAPMVRAILAGTKTQTRRMVKGTTLQWLDNTGFVPEFLAGTENGLSPYGQPGDRLWVKENYRLLDAFDNDSASRVAEMCMEAGYKKPWAPIQYEADGAREHWEHIGIPPYDGRPKAGKLRPNIFLPRWACRLELEVTSVRIEPLNDCSEADAIAEGIDRVENNFGNGPAYCDYRIRNLEDTSEWFNSPIDSYRTLWESINGTGSWEANPWVWVVEFKRVDARKQAAWLLKNVGEEGR